MSELLPIVEELADCTTHEQRRAWLLAVPPSVLYRAEFAIRAVLREAGFRSGIAYLEAELSVSRSVRLEDGSLPQTRVVACNIAKIDMAIEARTSGGT